MSKLIFQRITHTSLMVLLLVMTPAVKAQAAHDSPQISRLLAQAKTNASLVADDAEKLETYARTKVSWQTHGSQLEKIRAHVNDLIGDVNQLSALRTEGSPWQQEAIDRIDPLMKSMADHLTATIRHLNDNQDKLHMQPYIEYAHGNYVLAERTLAVIRDFVDYDEAQARADELEQKLSLPASSGD